MKYGTTSIEVCLLGTSVTLVTDVHFQRVRIETQKRFDDIEEALENKAFEVKKLCRKWYKQQPLEFLEKVADLKIEEVGCSKEELIETLIDQAFSKGDFDLSPEVMLQYLSPEIRGKLRNEDLPKEVINEDLPWWLLWRESPRKYLKAWLNPVALY